MGCALTQELDQKLSKENQKKSTDSLVNNHPDHVSENKARKESISTQTWQSYGSLQVKKIITGLTKILP